MILVLGAAGSQESREVAGFDLRPRNDEECGVLCFDFAGGVTAQFKIGFAGCNGKFSFTDE